MLWPIFFEYFQKKRGKWLEMKMKNKWNQHFLNAYQNKLELQVKLKWLHFCPPLLIISLEIFQIGMILLHVHSQSIYCNCVKFHNYHFIHQEGVALTRNMGSQTDKVISIYPPITLFALTNKIWFFVCHNVRWKFPVKKTINKV